MGYAGALFRRPARLAGESTWPIWMKNRPLRRSGPPARGGWGGVKVHPLPTHTSPPGLTRGSRAGNESTASFRFAGAFCEERRRFPRLLDCRDKPRDDMSFSEQVDLAGAGGRLGGGLFGFGTGDLAGLKRSVVIGDSVDPCTDWNCLQQIVRRGGEQRSLRW